MNDLNRNSFDSVGRWVLLFPFIYHLCIILRIGKVTSATTLNKNLIEKKTTTAVILDQTVA